MQINVEVNTNITYEVIVNTNDEYADSPATHARITLDKKLITRLFKLRKAVKTLKVYAIQDWDMTPELLIEGDDGKVEWDGSPDAMRLIVSSGDFSWEWYLKHTNILCDTETISFNELQEQLSENQKVRAAKKGDLPRLAVSELKYESSKNIVETRLKKG